MEARQLGSSAGIYAASRRMCDRLTRVGNAFGNIFQLIHPQDVDPGEFDSCSDEKGQGWDTVWLSIGDISKELHLLCEEVTDLLGCFNSIPEFVVAVDDDSDMFLKDLEVLRFLSK